MDKFSTKDYLLAISGVADHGEGLQQVIGTGIASARLADACGMLFGEIKNLADRAESPNDENEP
jgi:hypothetical protein